MTNATFYTSIAVLVILDPTQGTGALISPPALINPPFRSAE